MQSQECQIQEHDCGDYWSVAGAIVTVEGVRKGRTIFYKKGGKKYTVPSKGIGNRIVRKSGTYEKQGQWNTIELYTVGQTSVHVVNGTVMMVLTDSSRRVKGKIVPLTRGKIQIQSEGAEVYYRNIAIRPIERIPTKLLQ